MVWVLQFNASSIQCIYISIIHSIQPIAWCSVIQSIQSVEQSVNRNNSVVRVIKYIDGVYCVGSVNKENSRNVWSVLLYLYFTSTTPHNWWPPTFVQHDYLIICLYACNSCHWMVTHHIGRRCIRACYVPVTFTCMLLRVVFLTFVLCFTCSRFVWRFWNKQSGTVTCAIVLVTPTVTQVSLSYEQCSTFKGRMRYIYDAACTPYRPNAIYIWCRARL